MNILDLAIPRTLDALVTRLAGRPPAGPVDAWLFEDQPARRDAERRLAAAGVTARLRSAYKPLVHFFLEDADLAQVAAVEVRYPHHAQAKPGRFLLEAYPLAALLPGVKVTFIEGAEGLTYQVALTRHDGTRTSHEVFAPNVVRAEPPGNAVLATSGWLKTPDVDGPLETDFEALFLKTVETVVGRYQQGPRPPFDRLRIHIEMPGEDRALDYGKERISLREAMHEDLLFTLRDRLGADKETAARQRGAQPGQIVPDIHPLSSQPRLRISVETFGEAGETPGAAMTLASVDRPFDIAQVRRELSAIAGVPIVARSREGREVRGVYKAGTGPAVLITAAQHANETTGVVGGLRAAQRLAADPEAHFAIVPVENVDGYELLHRLIVANPHHMHHAARYSALGDDLWFYPAAPSPDRAARVKALELSGAQLHLNLHGYPSHEWARPMTGYLPRGYEAWSLPKGFFLIVNHHPGWGERALRLVEGVTARLSEHRALVALNAREVETAMAHMPDAPIRMMNGFAYLIDESDDHPTPLALITEAPDETIYGADYVMMHEAQMSAVLAAVETYRAICNG